MTDEVRNWSPQLDDFKLGSEFLRPATFARQITASRYRELEKHVTCFRECGVDLDRMHIVDSRDFHSSTLYVDGIARFTWKLEQPHYGYF